MPDMDAASLKGRGLQQIGLYRRDMARAREFYSDVLGLPFLFRKWRHIGSSCANSSIRRATRSR